MNDPHKRQRPVAPHTATCLFLLALTAACCTQARARDPRLFFTPQRIERLKAETAQPGEIADAWARIRQRADGMLDDKPVSREYAEGGQGQHGNYNAPSSQIANMGQTLGLAYRMTADKRYADKLTDAMTYYGTFSRWAGDAHHTPPWHSELNTARFCFGYAVAYDSIRETLSPADRKTIVEAMVRLGIGPTLDDWVLSPNRIHALDSMGHNWWSVCVAMAGLACLSITDDHPQAESWALRVNDAFDEWFAYTGNILQNKSTNFDPKGAFYESVSYANYALSEYLLFRLAWPGAFPGHPAPGIDLLETAGDFFIHTAYPAADKMLAVNFGDSNLNADGSHTLRLLDACGYKSEAHRWYLTRRDRGLGDPVALACGLTPTVDSPPAALPTAFAYEQIGWAMLRNAWTDDATLLAVKSGYDWNHAHPDHASFILLHKGKPLLIDSGNCSYSRSEYTSYYRRALAHNVVTIDGHAGNPEDVGRGTVTPGTVQHLLDLGDLKYVLADAAGPTSWKFTRNYRHVLWLDGVILILDDVRTHEPGRLEWLLHYEGRAETTNAATRITNSDAAVTVKMLHPPDVTITEKQGLKDHDPDTKVPYLAFSPPEPSREAKFITALLPSGGESPELEPIEADDALGVRITTGQTITEVYLNLMADGRKMHRNSCNIINGWDTDAAVFAITRPLAAIDDPDNIERYFIACGSYLRKNDKVVLDSLSKLYTAFNTTGNLDVQLSGQPLINARLRIGDMPAAVKLNDRNAPVRYNASDKTITLTLDQR